ncbi:MAG: FAD:protein FMN transferase, partial [Cellvibrionaceae bacterium]
IDDAEIMKFNRAEVDQWQPISASFLEVLTLSQGLAALTEGRFDITIGPLIELWGFGKREQGDIPSDDEINTAKSRVGWQNLVIDQQKSAIKKMIPLWLDVSAVAKGYGVDQISALLDQYNSSRYLVEIGGEMRVKGYNQQDRAWRVGIEAPSLLQRQAQQIVAFTDKAIATSGDYRNFFEKDGQRFSHTIDPSTGKPVRHNIASVTVIAETAAAADAYATALNVLGKKNALAFAEQQNLAAYFILYNNDDPNQDYDIVVTEQFKPFLVQ